MKNISLSFVMALMLVLFSGCREQVLSVETSSPEYSPAFNGEVILNEAFISSNLSQYAMDDTLFIIQFLGYDIENINARDIEEYDSARFERAGYFSMIPKYAESIIQIEYFQFDGNADMFIASPDLFGSVSTDDYALLIKDAMQSYIDWNRVTVTHNGVSASFDLRASGRGWDVLPHVADGYVFMFTIHP